MAHTASSNPEAPRPLSTGDQLILACLWLAYNVQWGALLFIVLPPQVAAIVGEASKESWLAVVLPAGALVSMIVTPIAGALSDRCRRPDGRRRPFLIGGMVINVLFLLGMATCGKGSNVFLFTLLFAGVQFGCNWWGGPYAGLLPDVVPTEQIGRASGYQALMTALGTVVGAIAGSALAVDGNFMPVYLFIIVVLVVSLVLTLVRIREPVVTTPVEKFEIAAFARSFIVDPVTHRNFYWVLITRAMICMGVYSISPYFQYFLQDVIKVSNPASATSTLMVVIIGMGIPTSVIAGDLSDKHGRKPLVYLSGTVMALACAVYVGVSFYPSYALTLLVAAFYGIGNGAYTAVDWALALDVLPSGEDAARDMGIWHVALVLPQVIAPAITGVILGTLKATSLTLGYTAVFGLATIWFVIGTVLVRQVRGVR